MLTDDQITEAATLLAVAMADRQPLGALPPRCSPSSVTDGYRIQRRLHDVAGIELGPWKVGATSELAQQLLGVDAPFIGRPDARRVCASGASIDVGGWFVGEPAIEVEVGVRPTVDLADLAELPTDPLELADRVEILPCIEVVDSRFGAVIGPPAPCLVADNGVASALVVGEPLALDADSIRALDRLPVSLQLDAGSPIEATAAAALGHPLRALHLAAQIGIELGTPARAGEIVSTGTCTGLTPVVAGMTVEGRVGDRTVRASFT